MPSYTRTRNESSVKTELSFTVFGKQFNNEVLRFVAIKFLGFVFPLNSVSFFGFGP